MIQIRLRTIFILLAILGIVAASIASHWHARSNFGLKVRSVTIAMKDENSEIESKLVNQLLEDPNLTGKFRRLAVSMVRCEGSKCFTQDGSFLSGQGYVYEIKIDVLSRDTARIMKLQSEDTTRASVIVRCETEWSIFSGNPIVTCTSQGFPLDDEYIDIFERVLSKNQSLEIAGG